MNIVKIKDKTFKTSIPEEEILKKVKAVADKINADMADKNPLLLAVLNGSFVFAADLMRMINILVRSRLSSLPHIRAQPLPARLRR